MNIASIGFALLPIAASFGWYVGRRDRDESSSVSKRIRHDYFRGLNYIINEQPDKAVDVFIKLLEVDSDTVEMHLALGNLFRRRGEVDRAIRIHQNLIARPQLEKKYHVQAVYALGEDYLRAGVLDRAERMFLELIDLEAENSASLRFLLHIYQQEKNWDKAIQIAKKLAYLENDATGPLIAQYYCELADRSIVQTENEKALSYLKEAKKNDPLCVRASLMQGELYCKDHHYEEAIKCYKQVQQQDPDFISEIVKPLTWCYQQLDQEEKLITYLQSCLAEYPRIAIVLAISDYLQRKHGDKVAIEFIAEQIDSDPSLRGLDRLVDLYINNSRGDAKNKLIMLKNFIENLLIDKPIYRCTHCGYSGRTLFWHCPSCHCWSTIKPIQGLEGG